MNHHMPLHPQPRPTRISSGPCGTALKSLARNISSVLPTRFDYWKRDYLECPDILNSTEPWLVGSLMREYLRAGAEILVANTFLSNPLFLPHYRLDGFERSLTREGIRIAKDSIQAFADFDNADSGYGPDRPVAVAVPLPPLPLASSAESLSMARSVYAGQIETALSAGADEFFIESVTDARVAGQASLAIADCARKRKRRITAHLSLTLGPDNRLPSGQTMAEALSMLEDFRYASIGINCVFPPERATEQVLRLASLTSLPLSMRPAASMSQEETPYDPERFAEAFSPLLESGRLAIAGACCGATPHHVMALRHAVDLAMQSPSPHINLNTALN